MKKQKRVIVIGIVALLGIVLLSSLFSKTKVKDYSNLVYVDGINLETRYKLETENMRLCQRLEKLKMQDEKLMGPVYTNFMRIRKCNRDLVIYIQNLRGELIARADQIAPKTGDTLRLTLIKNPDDITSVNGLMFRTGTKGPDAAAQLRDKFIQLEEELNKLPAYSKGHEVHIICEECLQMQTGNKNSWETIVFKDRKLIDVLITLDAISMKLAMTENDALHSYLDFQ
jgi:hypothetical protein